MGGLKFPGDRGSVKGVRAGRTPTPSEQARQAPHHDAHADWDIVWKDGARGGRLRTQIIEADVSNMNKNVLKRRTLELLLQFTLDALELFVGQSTRGLHGHTWKPARAKHGARVFCLPIATALATNLDALDAHVLP